MDLFVRFEHVGIQHRTMICAASMSSVMEKNHALSLHFFFLLRYVNMKASEANRGCHQHHVQLFPSPKIHIQLPVWS